MLQLRDEGVFVGAAHVEGRGAQHDGGHAGGADTSASRSRRRACSRRARRPALLAAAAAVRTISWPGGVKEGSKRRIARQLTPSSAARAMAILASTARGRRRRRAAGCRRRRERMRAPGWSRCRPRSWPMLTVTRAERLGLAGAAQRLGDRAWPWRWPRSRVGARGRAHPRRPQQRVERRAQPVDRVDAEMDVGAMRGRPVASISTHIKPFSPKRTTAGEPTSPMMMASPRRMRARGPSATGAERPMFSSSPASVSTTSPRQASRCSASSGQGEDRGGDAALHVAAPRP